jgi:hypothetical protein
LAWTDQAELAALLGPNLDPPLPAAKDNVALDSNRLGQGARKPQAPLPVDFDFLLIRFNVRQLFCSLLVLELTLNLSEKSLAKAGRN